MPVKSVQLGEVVLCKMRGFCEWPCIVKGFEKGMVSVEFFGDYSVHKAALSNFYNFSESCDVILANLRGRKTPLYMKSIKEAEAVLGIPLSNSITNEI